MRDIPRGVHAGLGGVGLARGDVQDVHVPTLAALHLRARGFTILTHRRVPPNDGGTTLEQTLVAATTGAA